MSNCCVDCFSRKSIRKIVRTQGDADIGEKCDFCGGTAGPFASPKLLGDAFRRVIDDRYVPVDQLSNARHIDAFEEGTELAMLLNEDLEVFSDAVLDKCDQLLDEILDAGGREDDRYPDGLWAYKEQDWIHWSHSDYWSLFAAAVAKHGHSLITPRGSIKGQHDVEGAVGVVRQSLSAMKRTLPERTKTWRGRIGTGLAGKMGAPPPALTTAGRINKQGEPVLYVCLDPKTPVYEVRPSIGDVVSVQRFITRRKLRVCDFSSRFDVCEPFVLSPGAYAKYQRVSTKNQIRLEIGRKLARPVRRGDEAKDYLATQFVATFAREARFDALMFSSTQRHGGVNLVLFDSDDAAPDGEVRERIIEGVSYRRSKRRADRRIADDGE
jgi:RES domain